MPRILLTGAAGFVGRAAAARLAREGFAVAGADLAPARGVAAVDLADAAGLAAFVRANADAAAVVHAGAISGPMLVGDDLARLFAVNVGGVIALLEAMRAAGIGRLVHLSSNAVYRPRAGEDPIDEDAPLGSEEPYGASKVAAEAAVAAYARRFGIAASVLRVSSIYGPGRRSPSLVGRLAAARPGEAVAVTGEGVNLRQLVHVEDVCAAIAAALARPAAPGAEAFNVAGAERLSEARIGAMAARLRPWLRLVEVPPPAIPDDVGPLDCGRAAERLRWRPRIALAEGLAALLAHEPEPIR